MKQCSGCGQTTEPTQPPANDRAGLPQDPRTHIQSQWATRIRSQWGEQDEQAREQANDDDQAREQADEQPDRELAAAVRVRDHIAKQHDHIANTCRSHYTVRGDSTSDDEDYGAHGSYI